MMQPPRATYRLQFTREFGFADAAAHRAVSRDARREPCVRVAISARAARQHARLRHRRARRAESRARRRRRLRAHERGVRAARASSRSSISCPTTWASAAPTIRCGSRCSSGDRDRRSPAGSTSIGSRPADISRRSCWCPCSGTNTAQRSKTASSSCDSTPTAGEFAVWAYDDAQAPDLPVALCARCSATNIRSSNASAMNSRALRGVAAADASGARTSSSASSRRMSSARDIRGAHSLDRAAGAVQWRSRRRAAGARCADPASSTGARATFASPATTSITGASSTSMISPACASSCPRCSSTRTGWWCRLLREGVLDGLRIDHIDGLLDPSAVSARLRGTRARSRRRVAAVLPRRGEDPRPRRTAAARNGRWKAPPATNSRNLVLRLLIDARGEAGLTRAYA